MSEICFNCNNTYGSNMVVVKKIGIGATHAHKEEDWTVVRHCCQNPQSDPNKEGTLALVKTGKFYIPGQFFTEGWMTGEYKITNSKGARGFYVKRATPVFQKGHNTML